VTAFPQLEKQLTSLDVRAIKKLAFALDQFEPFPSLIIPSPTLCHLVEVGAVESGPSYRPAVGEVGYRLTNAGWDVAVANWT
jgi:hypothetical protein